MIRLRPYQERCLSSIDEALAQGCRRQLISMSTGSGKTITFGTFIARQKTRALILAHTSELLQQAQDKIRMIDPDLSTGLVCANSKEFGAHVVICSIQSAILPRNLAQLQAQGFDTVVCDEAHHSASLSYRTVMKALRCGEPDGPLLLGFTATAHREDGRGLAEVFERVSFEIGIKELIQDGHLVKPKGVRLLSNLDLSQVQTSSGDYDATSLAQVMDTPEMIAEVVSGYLSHASGYPAICFGCSIAHSENLAAEFRKRGVRALCVSGKTPDAERKAILKGYSEGELDIVTNCSVLTEGFDAPCTGAVLIARPTRSRGLFQQMAGRALRLYPNKTKALILDFGDCSHSLVTSAELLQDSEVVDIDEVRQEELIKAKIASYPTKLNQRIKMAAVQADLLAEEQGFAWSKDLQGRYHLRDVSGVILRIEPEGHDLYSVRMSRNEHVIQELGSRLSFEYAFAVGSEFATQNRERFVLGDLGATWRNEPASERQIQFMKKNRFSAGLNELTRGQASSIIGSGALRRRRTG